MAFGYDTSILHHRHDVALSVTFNLTPGDRDGMNRILQENLAWRGARHPWLEIHPSAGSIFKKIAPCFFAKDCKSLSTRILNASFDQSNNGPFGA